MSLYHEFLVEKIKALEQGNLIIRLIGNPIGFYNFYSCSRWEFKSAKDCFEYCNQYYKEVFGRFLYLDFEEFKKDNQSNIISTPVNNALQILEREYLLTWFKSKGFNSWTSFKALVMHYYPATSESELLCFWKSESIVPEVQKNVGYVKQIIGD